MKKFWVLLFALLLTVGLAACSDSKEDETVEEAKKEEVNTEEATADTEKKVKSSMVQFYMMIAKTINDRDADLNAYEVSEVPPTAEMKTAASASATAVAKELEKIEVPEELKDHKEDLAEAVKNLTESYQVKAEELGKEKPALDVANETFVQGEEKLGKVFEDLGLNKLALSIEVNG